MHRIDPKVSLEESWAAMADDVRAGEAKALGLSEVTVEELERAHRIFPVASVQNELSLWTRGSLDVMRRCQELGIAFLTSSPLGRGLLTGRIEKPSDLDADDWRRNLPHFQDEATMRANRAWVDRVKEVARRHEATAGQTALAWLLHQAPNVIPIPGTRKVSRLGELDALPPPP
ncbi:hypothetical protein DRW03_13345 [Corallococcus sp. H22C18031201]|nr:hypothetical protein DRW03_13345 [Corallococcus sp. H22C18031201]